MTVPQYAQYAQPMRLGPPEVFSTEQRLSLLIHGEAKIGKSTLAGSAPKPILVIDGEGSWRFVALRRSKYWNPMTEPVPVWDGTWDICIVLARDWSIVDQVLTALLTYPMPFVSVVLDSISEIQRRLKDVIFNGPSKDPRQQWGTLLDQMTKTIRGYRDLCMVPQISVRCMIFVAETELDKIRGKWVPSMQGKIEGAMPYWLDMVGYLYSSQQPDTTGQMQEVRQLWIGPHPQFLTGSRLQDLLGYSLLVTKPQPGQTGTDIEAWMRYVFDVQNPIQAQTNGRIQP